METAGLLINQFGIFAIFRHSSAHSRQVDAHRRQWSASNWPQTCAQCWQTSAQRPHAAWWYALDRSIRLTQVEQIVAQSRQLLAHSSISASPIHWSAQYSQAWKQPTQASMHACI